MTHLRKMMLEELERRNYSTRTIRYYLRFVERFAKYFGKSPDKLGPDHLRIYQAYLLKERKLCPGTVVGLPSESMASIMGLSRTLARIIKCANLCQFPTGN